MKRATLISSLFVIAMLIVSVVFVPSASADSGKTRVFVQFAPGQRGAVESALKSAKAQFHYAFDDLDAFAVTLPVAALKGIQNNPNVVLVEEDVVRSPISIMPSKAQVVKSATGQEVPYGIDMVQARDVWDYNRDGEIDTGAPTGAGIKICIIDSGYYLGHEDLPGSNLVTGYNGNLPWDVDGFGHGSHVAGTITAMNNALGVVGVTPGTASLYIVRVFGDDGAWAYSSTLIDAAKKCQTAGAKIISMSLGGAKSSTTEKRGFDSLYSAGILSVAAAGNDGVDGIDPYSYPASYASVVSVAAIDEAKVVADFSQNNDQVELAAPGVAVLSTLPYLDTNTVTVDDVTYTGGHIEFSGLGTASGALVDGGLCGTAGSWSGKVVLCQRGDFDFATKVLAVQSGGGTAALIYNNVPGGFLGTMGESTATIIGISLSQEDGLVLLSKVGKNAEVLSTHVSPASGYEAWDGTSMATPHVSAVAALVWSKNPSLTNVQVRTALQSTAMDLGTAGRDAYYGFGLVQAKVAVDSVGGGGGTGGELFATLSSSKSAKGKTWTATVTILVKDELGAVVPDVTVSGHWSTGATATCLTGSAGTCSVKVSLSTSISSVTFTLDNLVKTDYTYTIPEPKQFIIVTK